MYIHIFGKIIPRKMSKWRKSYLSELRLTIHHVGFSCPVGPIDLERSY